MSELSWRDPGYLREAKTDCSRLKCHRVRKPNNTEHWEVVRSLKKGGKRAEPNGELWLCSGVGDPELYGPSKQCMGTCIQEAGIGGT